MDAATARERIFRLEEDRDLLLEAWKALDNLDRNHATLALSCRETLDAAEEHLTALDAEQSALIADLQDTDSGWKGGSVHTLAFHLLQRQTWRRVPRVGARLHERLEQKAREMGLSVRQVIEAALMEFLRVPEGGRPSTYKSEPPRVCPVCGVAMFRDHWESAANFRRRRTCSSRCGGILARGTRFSPPRSDAEIAHAVTELGVCGAARKLGMAQSTVSDRIRKVREREARKAA